MPKYFLKDSEITLKNLSEALQIQNPRRAGERAKLLLNKQTQRMIFFKYTLEKHKEYF